MIASAKPIPPNPLMATVSLLRIKRSASRAVTILLESPDRAVGTIWVTAVNLSLQSTACAVRFLYLVQLDSRLGSPRNRVDCGVHSDPGRAVKRVLVHLVKGPIHHSGKHALKIDAPLAFA